MNSSMGLVEWPMVHNTADMDASEGRGSEGLLGSLGKLLVIFPNIHGHFIALILSLRIIIAQANDLTQKRMNPRLFTFSCFLDD